MRRAFTLVEVTVAIVITGLVVTTAWAALQTGLDSADRLTTSRASVEQPAVARAILARALRHAVPGVLGGEPVFVLESGPLGDVLRFRTRGILEPAGATGVWEVELGPARQGMTLAGRPIDGHGAPFTTVLHDIRRVDVLVRGRDARDGWLESWIATSRSPVAVSITFQDRDGRAIGASLVARVGLEGNP